MPHVTIDETPRPPRPMCHTNILLFVVDLQYGKWSHVFVFLVLREHMFIELDKGGITPYTKYLIERLRQKAR